MENQNIMDKVKELIQKGNVSKIVVKRNDNVILEMPVTVGAAGVVIGLAYAQGLLLASVIAMVGFGCSVEVYMYDGTVKTILTKDSTDEIKARATSAVKNIKEDLHDIVSEATKENPEKEFDDTVSEDEQDK
jgi:ElaB/YqjD/DUF883 family membrane-anchored ribosome-binding protein